MSKLIIVILCFCCDVLYLLRLMKFRSFSKKTQAYSIFDRRMGLMFIACSMALALLNLLSIRLF